MKDYVTRETLDKLWKEEKINRSINPKPLFKNTNEVFNFNNESSNQDILREILFYIHITSMDCSPYTFICKGEKNYNISIDIINNGWNMNCAIYVYDLCSKMHYIYNDSYAINWDINESCTHYIIRNERPIELNEYLDIINILLCNDYIKNIYNKYIIHIDDDNDDDECEDSSKFIKSKENPSTLYIINPFCKSFIKEHEGIKEISLVESDLVEKDGRNVTTNMYESLLKTIITESENNKEMYIYYNNIHFLVEDYNLYTKSNLYNILCYNLRLENTDVKIVIPPTLKYVDMLNYCSIITNTNINKNTECVDQFLLFSKKINNKKNYNSNEFDRYNK